MRARSFVLRAIVATSVAAMVPWTACRELPTIAQDVCGNAIVERSLGEECDTHVPQELVDACRAERGEAADGVDPCALACARAGAEHACRFVWEEGKTSCPVGFGAGADGQCRRPSGLFHREPIAVIDGTGLELNAADFDGDGVVDVAVTLQNAATLVQYFQTGGAPSLRLSAPPGLPVAALLSDTLSNDHAHDLVISLGPGLVALRGDPGPTLSRMAYAPFASPGTVFALGVGLELQAAQVPPGFDVPVRMEPGAPIKFRALDLETASDGAVIAEFPVSNMHGEPVFADLVEDSISFVGLKQMDIAIATKGPDRVYIAAPSAPPTPPVEIDFPGLVALMPLAGKEGAVVVHQISERLWLSTITASPTGPSVGAPQPLPIGIRAAQILAVGHLNDDLQLDFVAPDGIHVFNPLAAGPIDDDPYILAGPSFGDAWARAEIADLHGDGRPEVIALPESGDVVVYLPSTSFAFNPGRLDLPGAADLLAVGDYDGDSVQDVMVVTEPDPDEQDKGCSDPDEFYILWGNPAGVPDPPERVGSLASVRRILPMRLFLTAVLDGIVDVGVESGCPPSEQLSYLGVFVGATNRAVAAPFIPFAELNRATAIERIATGDVGSPSGWGQPDGHADIAVVARRTQDTGVLQREIRIVPVEGDIRMFDIADLEEPPVIGTGVQEEPALSRHRPAIAVANLFPSSAADEVVVLHVQDPDVVRLTVFEGTPDHPSTTFDLPSIMAPDTLSRLRILDFDGDGDLDVVALTAAENTVQANVLLNDGAALAAPVPLSVPGISFVFDAAPILPPRCDGALFAGCDPTPVTVFAGFPNVFACPQSGGASCRPLIAHGTFNVAIAVADVDGDGVEDLITAQEKQTLVFRQCSVDELMGGLCSSVQ